MMAQPSFAADAEDGAAESQRWVLQACKMYFYNLFYQ
jgi:hypothetical protein